MDSDFQHFQSEADLLIKAMRPALAERGYGIFDKVQDPLVYDTRTSPKERAVHLSSGLLKYVDYRKPINCSQSGKNTYYYSRIRT